MFCSDRLIGRCLAKSVTNEGVRLSPIDAEVNQLLKCVHGGYNVRDLSHMPIGCNVFAERLNCPVFDRQWLGPNYDETSVVAASRRQVRDKRTHKVEKGVVPKTVKTPTQMAFEIDVFHKFNLKLPVDTVNQMSDYYASLFLPAM